MTTTIAAEEATTEICPRKFLSGTLPTKAPSRNEKLYIGDISGHIDVQPIQVKITTTSNTFAALSPAVNQGELRLSMTGVYHDLESKSMCVTNGHYLIVIPDDTVSEHKIVSVKDGSTIPDKFPNYRSVIPFFIHKARIPNVSLLLGKLKGIIRAGKFTSENIFTAIKYRFSDKLVGQTNEHICFLNAEYLYTALLAMVKTGSVAIDIELPMPGDTTGIVLRDAMDSDKLALVMLLSGETDNHEFKAIASANDEYAKGFVFSTVLDLEASLKSQNKIHSHFYPLLELARNKPEYVRVAEDYLSSNPESEYCINGLQKANKKWQDEISMIEFKIFLASGHFSEATSALIEPLLVGRN